MGLKTAFLTGAIGIGLASLLFVFSLNPSSQSGAAYFDISWMSNADASMLNAGLFLILFIAIILLIGAYLEQRKDEIRAQKKIGEFLRHMKHLKKK